MHLIWFDHTFGFDVILLRSLGGYFWDILGICVGQSLRFFGFFRDLSGSLGDPWGFLWFLRLFWDSCCFLSHFRDLCLILFKIFWDFLGSFGIFRDLWGSLGILVILPLLWDFFPVFESFYGSVFKILLKKIVGIFGDLWGSLRISEDLWGFLGIPVIFAIISGFLQLFGPCYRSVSEIL